jgi:large subunit ribosomal protein L35
MQKTFRPLGLCSTCSRRYLSRPAANQFASRSFASSTICKDNPELDPPSSSDLVPERLNAQDHLDTTDSSSIRGSKRRRAAIATSPQIPFEQLPYQCFQEALKLLKEDRAEKLEQIGKYRQRILRQVERNQAALAQAGDDAARRHFLARGGKNTVKRMTEHLTWLKVQADINDPAVKRRFEDGLGELQKMAC